MGVVTETLARGVEQLLGQVAKGDENDSEAAQVPLRRAANTLWQQELEALEHIAAQIKSVGTREVMYGRALVNQQRLDTVMQTLSAKILSLGRKRRTSRGDVALIAKLTHSLAQLSGKTTDSQRLLVEIERAASPPPDANVAPAGLVKSFAPGQIVGPFVDDFSAKGHS